MICEVPGLCEHVVERLKLPGICTGEMMLNKSPLAQNFCAHESVASDHPTATISPPPPAPLPKTGQDGTNHRWFRAFWCAMTGEQQKIQTCTSDFIDNSFMTHRARLRKSIVLH
jgi:hypothetical protein